MMYVLQEVGVAVALVAGLWIALEIGFRLGARAADASDPRAAGQIGAIQAAVLGLLGLLLAFSFAAAGSRFLERQDLIVQEANAIGTSYLRADLLAEPSRTELRGALQQYTEHRLGVVQRIREGLTSADAAEVERLHDVIWKAAMQGVADRPGAVLAVLPPINDVIDLHTTRLAAARKRLPALIMGMLIGCSVLAVGDLGYGSGVGGRRRTLLTLSLILVIAGALWVTIDLDHPRGGLLQLSDAPLRGLKFAGP